MRAAWMCAAALLAVLGACAWGAPPECDVMGQGPAADRALARDACQRARTVYAELLGVNAPPMRVYLTERAVIKGHYEDGWWAMRWPTSATLDSVRRKLGVSAAGGDGFNLGKTWAEEHWEQLLPHEIGHLLLVTATGMTDSSAEHGARSPHYATALPDWFDESVAMWMEPREYRDARLARVIGDGRKPPRIAAVLGWIHPSGGEVVAGWNRTATIRTRYGPCRGVCALLDTRTKRITASVDTMGRAVADTVYLTPEADTVPTPIPADDFYAPSLAAMTYVHERGGTPAVRELFARLRAGAAPAEQLSGLPGLPRDPAALQADWEAWWAAAAKRVVSVPPTS